MREDAANSDDAGGRVRFTAAGVRQGLSDLGPIAVMTLPFGLAFGATAIDRGVPLEQAIVMNRSYGEPLGVSFELTATCAAMAAASTRHSGWAPTASRPAPSSP